MDSHADNREDLVQPELDRSALSASLGPCLHPARSLGQADIFSLEGSAGGWLLKDFSARPLWMRLLVTRRALAREFRALRFCQGLQGIPIVASRLVDADAMLIEQLSALRLPHRKDNYLTPEFFDRLRVLIDTLHGRGLAHGDLRRKNILVNRESLQPFLIDFATAWQIGESTGAVGRFLFKHWCRIDLISITRIKAAYFPDALSAEDKDILAHQPWHLKLGRFVRKKLYRPLKARHRRKLWQRIKTLGRRPAA